MKFMHLIISIREDTFKDVLEIKNSFDLDYLHRIKQSRCVNPYEPPSFQTKRQKKILDFREFSFAYEFNKGQQICLRCDNLGMDSEGVLDQLDETITLKGIHLSIRMVDQYDYDVFEIKAITHIVKFIEDTINGSSQNKQQVKSLEFDTLTLRISDSIDHLADYFEDLKGSINRVKDFSQQLNLGTAPSAAATAQQQETMYGGDATPVPKTPRSTEFISQAFPNPFRITWKNLSIILEDTRMDCFLLGYQQCIRDHFSQQNKKAPFSDRQVILTLQAAKQSHPLLGIYCDELVLSLEPLKSTKNADQVLDFIDDIEESKQSRQQQFSSFSCLFGSAGFTRASVTMRDYPEKLLSMEKGSIQTSMVIAQLSDKFSSSGGHPSSHSLRVFYNLVTEFSTFDLTMGLCQASGINALLARIKRLTSPKIKNTENGESEDSSLKSNNSSYGDSDSDNDERDEYFQHYLEIEDPIGDKSQEIEEQHPSLHESLPFWDRLCLCYHGKIVMSKDSVMSFNLLTHIYPYSTDKLKFSIGKSFLMVKEGTIKFYCQDLLLKRKPRPENESHVLKIPLIQVEVDLNWNRIDKDHYSAADGSEQSLARFKSKKLNVHAKLNLPRVEPSSTLTSKKMVKPANFITSKMKRLVKVSEVPFVHYQLDFVNWLRNLPQLRQDQLALYKIGVSKKEKEVVEPISATATKKAKEFNELGGNQQKRATVNVKFQESEEKREDVDVRMGKTTDFMSLFAYSVNSQLNSKSLKHNIFQHIADIKVAAFMTSTRCVMSNSASQLISDPDEDGDPFSALDPIIGMQFVFDSISLSCNISHKASNATPTVESFQASNGFGKLDAMYGSVFRTKANLLSLDPPQFRRNVDKKKSMQNPARFAAYFDLKNLRLAEDKMIFSIQDDLSGSFKKMAARIDIKWEHLKIPQTDFSQYTAQATSTAADESAEFDFTISGIFFASGSVIYEQNRCLGFEVSILDDKGVAHKEITPKQIIKHILSFKGCKLLVTTQLNAIIANVFGNSAGDSEDDNVNEVGYGQQHKASGARQKMGNPNASDAANNKQKVKQVGQVQDVMSHLLMSGTGSSRMQRNLWRRKDESDGKVKTKLEVVVQIEEPQFNLFYKQEKNQMVMTSREKCFVIVQTHQLPYDKHALDLKQNVKLFFNNLDCFGVKEKVHQGSHMMQVQWADTYDDPTRKIQHIIRASHTVIDFSSFNLSKCFIDFTSPLVEKQVQPSVPPIPIASSSAPNAAQKQSTSLPKHLFTWNGVKRSRGFDLRVQNLFSEFESRDYRCFVKTLEFFNLLMKSEIKQKQWAQSLRLKKNELKYWGISPVFEHIQRELLKKKSQSSREQESHISYYIENCILKLLDHHRRPFLDFRLPNIRSTTLNQIDNQGVFRLEFGQVKLRNMMEDGDFMDMIEYSGNDHVIRMENDFTEISGINPNTLWRAYNRYECFVPPLTLKLTEDIYEPFYEFVFADDQNRSASNSLQSSQSTWQNSPPPTGVVKSQSADEDFEPYFYYDALVVHDLKMCLHYKTESSLKRLNGVTVMIAPYHKDLAFVRNKELFDDFVSYVKRQVASQIFSLLSQKFFGYSKNIEGDDDEKKAKKLN